MFYVINVTIYLVFFLISLIIIYYSLVSNNEKEITKVNEKLDELLKKLDEERQYNIDKLKNKTKIKK